MEFSGIGAEIAIFYPVKLQIILKGIRCILLDCDHSVRFFDAKLSLNIGKSKLCCPHLLLCLEVRSSRSEVSWLLDLLHSSVLSELSHGTAWEAPSIVHFHRVLCSVWDKMNIGFVCSCIPRSHFCELAAQRCRRFHVQARELCVSRDLQSRLRYQSVQELCGPGTPRCATPQSLQCSAQLNNSFVFLVWFLYVFFFSHGFGFFFSPTMFRTVSCSDQPSQHNPQYHSGFFLALPNLIFCIPESCLDGLWRCW